MHSSKRIAQEEQRMVGRKNGKEIQPASAEKSPINAPELLTEIRGLINQTSNRIAIAVNTALNTALLAYRKAHRYRKSPRQACRIRCTVTTIELESFSGVGPSGNPHQRGFLRRNLQ